MTGFRPGDTVTMHRVSAGQAEFSQSRGLPELQRGEDVDLVHLDLRQVIAAHVRAHPRSQQKRIGPSELGTPCARKLAYKVTGSALHRQDMGTAWRPAVGTAVHAYLEKALIGYNDATGQDRYLTETPVNCGEIDGVSLIGSVDVYDVARATVVDFKIVGPTSLKKARSQGASAIYRTQVQLYGRGFTRAGWPVDHVAILWLPSAGEIAEAVFWSEPYDENVALAAISRAEALAQAIRLGGAENVIPSLPRADDWCQSCPWFSASATEASVSSCPGERTERPSDVAGLIGPTKTGRKTP